MYAYNWRMGKRWVLAKVIVLSISVFLSACSSKVEKTVNSNSNSRSNQSNAAAKTNIEELSVLINFPYETEDIVWKENDVDKKLIAVFKLSQADATKLVIEAEKAKPAQAATLSTESWYPAELIAQSSMSGDDSLSGKSYSAVGFLQEPYKSGTFTRVDNSDFFVLELSAK